MFQETIFVDRTVFGIGANAKTEIILYIFKKEFYQYNVFDYPINNEIDIWDGHISCEELWNVFDEVPEFTRMKLQIVEAIHKMRENNLAPGTKQTAEILVLPEEKLNQHISCKINQNVMSNDEAMSENEVSQFELKQKLATVDKDSENMKFFEDKKCSVCLSNYKEIFDEDLHIVVPSCGHPLCCKCADNILESEKKECPQCRERITADAFNLMKFNANLQIDSGNQKLYL